MNHENLSLIKTNENPLFFSQNTRGTQTFGIKTTRFEIFYFN